MLPREIKVPQDSQCCWIRLLLSTADKSGAWKLEISSRLSAGKPWGWWGCSRSGNVLSPLCLLLTLSLPNPHPTASSSACLYWERGAGALARGKIMAKHLILPVFKHLKHPHWQPVSWTWLAHTWHTRGIIFGMMSWIRNQNEVDKIYSWYWRGKIKGTTVLGSIRCQRKEQWMRRGEVWRGTRMAQERLEHGGRFLPLLSPCPRVRGGPSTQQEGGTESQPFLPEGKGAGTERPGRGSGARGIRGPCGCSKSSLGAR